MERYLEALDRCNDLESLEKIRIDVLGRKGFVTTAFEELKTLPNEEKRNRAKELNAFKELFTSRFQAKYQQLEDARLAAELQSQKIDLSLYEPRIETGGFHPIRLTMERIVDFFVAQNFSVEEGPIVENDFNNFEALNLPKYHPARDMQDTFYMNDGMLLRTHTSSVQIRTMLASKPPIRMIAPGVVCRRDYDATHVPMFHQVEGLVVDEEGRVSFAHLKAILVDFLTDMFEGVKVRFRPSFFPFTEPSAEVDISCIFCHGKGCRVCKQTGWLEVLGCGVVDPNVFAAVGYERVSGYAFGLGVERFAMLMYRVPDMRGFYEGDLRLLEQFS
ncbi:MAG: phenylalanine--tRNA ligase subunit alpha [Campylobacterales bacterium]